MPGPGGVEGAVLGEHRPQKYEKIIDRQPPQERKDPKERAITSPQRNPALPLSGRLPGDLPQDDSPHSKIQRKTAAISMSLILMIYLDFSTSLSLYLQLNKEGLAFTKVSDMRISLIIISHQKMDSPSMLYVQENNSLNTARIVKVSTLPEALNGKASLT